MTAAPTIADVLDRLGEDLGLEAVRLERGRCPAFPPEPPTGGFPTLVGHLNVVQPNRIQVFGPAELEYWAHRDTVERADLVEQIFRADLYALIVSDGQSVPDELLREAKARPDVAILRATAGCERVISTLRHVLGQDLAARLVLHGVFMDVLGTGVLLRGDSAVGKSELALELISRGHSLVADDAPEFSRPAPDAIEGEASPILQDFLEVRGLGVLNIRSMYGDTAIRHRKRLHLIIQLEPLTDALRAQLDRLRGNITATDVLGIDVPTMTLPVAPGRNLAVMVEAGVRSFLLRRRGYDAAADIDARQRRAMEGDG